MRAERAAGLIPLLDMTAAETLRRAPVRAFLRWDICGLAPAMYSDDLYGRKTQVH